MGGPASDAAAQILDEHRAHGFGCTCGWKDASQTHAQHVLHSLQMAGLDVVWR